MMSDILDDLAGLRPRDLDPAVPGWEARREQLLHELDARVASDADVAPAVDGAGSGARSDAGDDGADATPRRPANDGRRRRWLLAAAAAAVIALAVIVGTAVQTGQRVQPEPAQTVSARTIDPDRPVYEVGAGQFFLRRASVISYVEHRVETTDTAVWFDDRGTMWTYSAAPGSNRESSSETEADSPDNPMSFVAALPDDPTAAEAMLSRQPIGVVNSVLQASDANLTPRQFQTLQQVLLRQKGAKRLADGADTLSRPATVIQAPIANGMVVRCFFATDTGELLETRAYTSAAADPNDELSRRVIVTEVRDSVPTPPFEPVIPTATAPAAGQLNRPVSPGQYLRRVVTVEDARGHATATSTRLSAAS